MAEGIAAGAEVLTVEQALRLLKDRTRPVDGVEEVELTAALGRVLAADVVAGLDVPAAANSAVDGFAACHDDLAAGGETRLRVAGRIVAGRPLQEPVERGRAYRIFTGAVLPPGLDTVFMQEDVKVDGDHVLLPATRRGSHCRSAGEDIRAGATAIPAGTVLRPQELGVAAALGHAALAVRRRVRVAVFSTGDEVFPPGAALPPGGIYDANRFSVGGILRSWDCAVTDLGILPDRPAVLSEALSEAAAGHDALVTSGGVSVGDEDHVKDVIAELGAIHFWRLAIKPGRPIALGRVGGAAFVGLPGNPVSAMLTCLRIARPLLLRMAGRTAVDPHLYPVRAGFAASKKPGRREWVRTRLEDGSDGIPVARKFGAQGSAMLSSMTASDGVVELPETCAGVTEGDLVPFLPFAEVLR